MNLIGPARNISNGANRGMQHHDIVGRNAQRAKVFRQLLS
jgi:hypothetical protein